jgi:4-hydroxybenzoate polyprenyltransferase
LAKSGNNLETMTQASNDRPVADALPQHWADKLLPAGIKPYARLARLERPVGSWLLAIPGLWAISLAQISRGGGVPDMKLIILFLIGAIVMRGAGCTLNDIVDRDFDGRVLRTRNRPIPSGQVSVKAAAAFLAALLAAGLLILLQLNGLSIALGAASLALVAIYPFMKRVTYWPQLFLGFAFNWGALLGFAAVSGTIGPAALSLYAGGIFWTLAYDTIYAHQDREEDVLIGVKSSALKLGEASKPWIAAFFILGLGFIDLSGILLGAPPIFHFGVAAATAHAAWQLSQLDIDDPASCLQVFRSNRDFGLLLFAGAFLASLASQT